jgi:4-amino-4-deoxy-L-arabinose transferase-like glycosyltransferase
MPDSVVFPAEKETMPKKGLNPILLEAIVLFGAFVLIFASYILVKPINGMWNTVNGAMAKVYGGIFLFAVLLYFFIEWKRKKLTFRKKVYILLALAFVIHLTYMLYTSAYSRQYDTWSDNHDAHYDYALAFYSTWHFPTDHITADTIYQFYHPPLAYFLQAIFMHVFEGLCTVESLTADTKALFSACQILSCFYTFVISLVGAKIILKSKLSEESKLMAIAIVALYPRLTQLSGQLNNDDLSIVFSVLAIEWFVKWYFEKKSWLNILMTSLFIGLALMSKMSAASICIGIGIAMVIEFVRSLQKKEGSLPIGKLILQYVAFLAICAPLGLWFQVYTHKVYGLPYNFVFLNLNSDLFTGTRAWVEKTVPDRVSYYDEHNSGPLYESLFVNFAARYVSPFLISDFTANGLYCGAFSNYNILSYALRSSIFGEFSYWQGEAFALLSVIAIYVLWFLLVIYLCYAFIRQRKMGRDGALALYLAFGIILMYLYLQYKMPFGCSMDFRYIVPIIVPIAYLVGKMNDRLKEEKDHPKFFQGYQAVLSFAVPIFVGSSYVFYLMAI